MKVEVFSSKIKGEIQSPASKSMLQRAIAAAFLAEHEVQIEGYSKSADADAVLHLISNLGVEVQINESVVRIKPVKIPQSAELNIGESGLGIRLFSPILALFENSFVINAKGTLKKRPMHLIENVLKANYVECSTNNGFAPIRIKGPIKGGKIKFDANEGSQLLSGLLMALPKEKTDSEIEIINLKSKPYIDMTISLLKEFGIEIQNKDYTNFRIRGNQNYNTKNYKVEGDWSGAAFILVAAAISGSAKLHNLKADSLQGDKAIVNVLKQVGSIVLQNNDNVFVQGKNLKAFNYDATETPDLFPPLAALASACKGVSRIKGVHRLKYKESNRAEAIQNIFEKFGLKIELIDDEMIIHGGLSNGGLVSSFRDHRMAMMAAVIGLVSKNSVTITEAESIQKSYPNFYEDLKILGANLNIKN